MNEETIEERGIRPITDTLRRVGKGLFMDEASEQLAELVKSVDATGRAGTLTLTIAVKKASHSGAMVVGAKTKLTKPKEPDHEALFFGTPNGNLLSEDPRQENIQFGVVKKREDRIANVAG